jgi:hypothetical protein
MANTGHATVTRDPDAQDEFRKRHGVLNPDVPIGNAEALQRAYRASQSRAVAKASLLPIDNAATADLDLDEVEGQLGGDTFHAAAVRGNAIVVVAEDANGRVYKTVLPANDRYVAPPEGDPAEEAASNSELAFQAEVAKLRAEFEAELAKVQGRAAPSSCPRRSRTLASRRSSRLPADAEQAREGRGRATIPKALARPSRKSRATIRRRAAARRRVKSTRSRSGGQEVGRACTAALPDGAGESISTSLPRLRLLRLMTTPDVNTVKAISKVDFETLDAVRSMTPQLAVVVGAGERVHQPGDRVGSSRRCRRDSSRSRRRRWCCAPSRSRCVSRRTMSRRRERRCGLVRSALARTRRRSTFRPGEEESRPLNTNPALNELSVDAAVRRIPGYPDPNVDAMYDYWQSLLGGVHAPAFEVSEVDWAGTSGMDSFPRRRRTISVSGGGSRCR